MSYCLPKEITDSALPEMSHQQFLWRFVTKLHNASLSSSLAASEQHIDFDPPSNVDVGLDEFS